MLSGAIDFPDVERLDACVAVLRVSMASHSASVTADTVTAVANCLMTGGQPETKTFPPADSLGVLLEAFAETIETGTPFPVSTADMLDVVSAFEATIRSIAEGRPVAVARG